MAEIQEMTGFQSPCAEFAEDELSLDKVFIPDRAAMFAVIAASDRPQLGIQKNDKLIILRGKTPVSNQIVMAVISNQFVLAKFQWINGQGVLMPYNKRVGDVEQNEDFIWGVLSSLHRKFS